MPKVIKYRRPPLFDYQLEAVFGLDALAVVEACTKVGKTHVCLVWLNEQVWLNGAPGREFWWVAPSVSQAKIAFNRSKRALKGVCTWNITERAIFYPNGAVLRFKTGDNPDLLYGEDVWAAVIDEGGRCRYDAYVAIISTLTHTEGPLRIIGNVHGVNWFYSLCREVANGDHEGKYTQLTWRDGVRVGVIKQSQVDWARAQLEASEFQQLYEAELPLDTQMFVPQRLVAFDTLAEMKILDTVRFWDFAATPEAPGKDPDWTVGLKMSKGLAGDGELWYIVRDVVRRRLDPAGVEDLVVTTARLDGPEVRIGLEQEPGSAGKMVSNLFKRKLKGYAVREQRVTGSKIERARGPSTYWGHGKMSIEHASWNTAFIRECAEFPGGKHDDQVDAMSGAHHKLRAFVSEVITPDGS